MDTASVSASELLSALSARGLITPAQLNEFRSVALSLAAAQATPTRAPLVPPSKPPPPPPTMTVATVSQSAAGNGSAGVNTFPSLDWARADGVDNVSAAVADFVLSDADVHMCAFESVYLSSDLLSGASRDHRNIVQTVIAPALQLSVPPQTLVNALTPPRQLYPHYGGGSPSSTPANSARSDHFTAAEAMTFVNYRLDIIRYATVGTLNGLGPYRQWAQRQLKLILSALLWTSDDVYHALSKRLDKSMQHERAPADAITNQTNAVRSYVHRVIAVVRAADLALRMFCSKTQAGHSAAATDAEYDKAIEAIADTVNAFPSSASDDAVVRIRYPRAVCDMMYGALIQALVDRTEKTARLHIAAADIVDAIKTVRTVFPVSERFRSTMLIVVCWNIVVDQSTQCESVLDAPAFIPGARSIQRFVQDALSSLTKTAPPQSDTVFALTSSKSDTDRVRNSVGRDVAALFDVFLSLKPPLGDYHFADAPAVSLCARMFVTIGKWFGVANISDQLAALMKKSVTSYYASFMPKANVLRKSSAQSADSSIAGGDVVIAVESKSLASFSAEDWSAFAAGLCEAIAVDSDEYVPAFEEIGAFPFPAEISLATLIETFNHDVSDFISSRDASVSGLDDVGLTVISALSVVRSHLLLRGALFSDHGKRQVITSFPDIKSICTNQLGRWMFNQKAKITALRERLQAMDGAFTPIDDRTPHPASVLDMFSILSTVTGAFFSNVERMAPYGVGDIPLYFNMIDQSVVAYSTHIVESCGSIGSLVPHGDDDYKLKQSAPDGIKLLAAKSKTSTQKAAEEMDLHSQVNVHDPTSLAHHSLEELLVRFSALDQSLHCIDDLNQQIRQSVTDFVHKHPIIAPSRKRVVVVGGDEDKADDDDGEFSKRRVAGADSDKKASVRTLPTIGVSSAVWQSWNLPLPDPIPNIDGGALVSSRTAVLKGREQVGHLLGVYAVYIRLRTPLLVSLYSPSAAKGERINEGLIENELNALMPTIFRRIPSSTTAQIARNILACLMSALIFVTVYGRRVIEVADVNDILKADCNRLEELFSSELSADELATVTRDYRHVLSVMSRPTNDLIGKVEANDSTLPVPLMMVVRIIGLRSGKVVAAFMKNQREKQKKRQMQSQTYEAPTPTAVSAAPAAMFNRVFKNVKK